MLKKVFTGMLEGALRKCVDPYFCPPEGYSLSDIEDVEVCPPSPSLFPLEYSLSDDVIPIAALYIAGF